VSVRHGVATSALLPPRDDNALVVIARNTVTKQPRGARVLIRSLAGGVARAQGGGGVAASAGRVAKLNNDGAEAIAGTPEEFGAFLRAETLKWAKLAKAAGIKPE
jgi:hypothetical protein